MELSAKDISCRGPTEASHWIIPKLLLASRYPGADDSDEHQRITRLIYDCGIEVFVNLMTPRELSRYKLYEPQIRQYALHDNRKVEFISFPIPDQFICRDDQKVLDFCMDLSKRLQENQQKILIHCRGGRGRTGTIMSILIGILFHLEAEDALNYNYQLQQQRMKIKGRTSYLHPLPLRSCVLLGKIQDHHTVGISNKLFFANVTENQCACQLMQSNEYISGFNYYLNNRTCEVFFSNQSSLLIESNENANFIFINRSTISIIKSNQIVTSTASTSSSSTTSSSSSTTTTTSSSSSTTTTTTSSSSSTTTTTSSSSSSTATTVGLNNNSMFLKQAIYSIGTQAYSLAIADFNNDNKSDIVVVRLATNDVGLLINSGNDGTFSINYSYAVGSSPRYVIASDVNNDNKIDVIVTNYNSNSVSILLNKGDAAFASQTTMPVGVQPWTVTAADLNGDGYVDLIATNSASNSISILFNLRDGAFQNQITYAVGKAPRSVIAADINGDNLTDVIVGNEGADTISVLMNTGSGSFSAQITYAVGDQPNSISATDVNNDNSLDLIVANQGSTFVSVLLNKGDGVFHSQVTYTIDIGSRCIVVTDLNYDNKPDIVVATQNTDSINVLLNTNNGTFGYRTVYTVGDGPRSVSVADLNNDNKPDMAVANSNTNIWLVVYYMDEDRENFIVIVTAFVIVMLFLPHLSNNCMLIAYIQELVLISDLDSCLGKLKNWKMMRWTVCFILYSAIPLIGMPIILITDFFVDTTEKFVFHSFWMSYVILVGIVPSILMILVVSFSHRNDYRGHQETGVTLTEISNEFHRRFIFTMTIQVLATVSCLLMWTTLLAKFAIGGDENLKHSAVPALIITFYIYNINHIKSFYVFVFTLKDFREKLIQTCSAICRRRSHSTTEYYFVENTQTRLSEDQETHL
ncbi:unnamed protein product [Adineta ricciae]|uniref:Tyrosine specific protein phosphatases domain-containing protein n=1 Tax=Adineta ricciae TaxID=249248 RepID=A0A814XRZ9_ADIRI|nr:unnamed protein product [Adineta ricciae]